MKINVDLWCSDYKLIAKNMMDEHGENIEETIAIAEKICENKFVFRDHWEMERTNEVVSLTSPIKWDHQPADDEEWMFAFNRHSIFVVLGKAWLYTKNRKYAVSFYRLFEDWLDNVPLTEDSYNTTWRTIEAGIRIENWLRAISIFKDSDIIDKKLEDKIIQSLNVHAKRLIDNYEIFHILSNWGVLQNHGLFLIGTAFDNIEWQKLAIKRLEEAVHYQLCDDGSHWEQSPLYHCEVLHCFLNTVIVAKKTGYYLSDSFLSSIEKMVLALAYMIKPNGKLVCQSDSDEVNARDLIILGAYLFDSPKLKAYSGKIIFEENYYDFADGIGRYSTIDSAARIGSVALEDSGNYMLWDNITDDADFMHFKTGFLGSGHGHVDILHIDLISHGEDILIDSGRYTYVDSSIRSELKSSRAHNTITINSKDFTVTKGSWDYLKKALPIKGQHKFAGNFDYVEGTHLGYLEDGAVVNRKVLRIGKGLWVVWDFIHKANDALTKVNQHFHFGKTGSVTVSENTACFDGSKGKAILAFLAEDLSVKLGKAKISDEYNKLEESDYIETEVNTKQSVGIITVIATGEATEKIDLSCKLQPVFLAKAKQELASQNAQGVKIVLNNKEWTVIICNNEIIAGVDMLKVENNISYGKVIVFGDNYPKGRTLAW